MNNNLPNDIKWRGSTYTLERVEDGKVYWYNPVSRHRQSCSVESWKVADPYDGKYS